jgi:hypothetical protein
MLAEDVQMSKDVRRCSKDRGSGRGQFEGMRRQIEGCYRRRGLFDLIREFDIDIK